MTIYVDFAKTELEEHSPVQYALTAMLDSRDGPVLLRGGQKLPLVQERRRSIIVR